MANHADLATTILEAIVTAVQTAWSIETISLRRPVLRMTQLPYAAVWLDSWSQDYSGAASSLTSTNATATFGVMGRFAFPSDPTDQLEYQKLAKLSALFSQFQAASTFSEGILPIITTASFVEVDDGTNAAYELTVMFQVFTRATHH